jgi:hypothetical protein
VATRTNELLCDTQRVDKSTANGLNIKGHCADIAKLSPASKQAVLGKMKSGVDVATMIKSISLRARTRCGQCLRLAS